MKSNPKPDSAFFDIQLADGNSFEIFDRIKIDTPIIFTTAYDAGFYLVHLKLISFQS
jgi:DNA-binding LytR/AlgR family response regulator